MVTMAAVTSHETLTSSSRKSVFLTVGNTQSRSVKPVFHFNRNVSSYDILRRNHLFHSSAQETKKYVTFRYDTVEVENRLNGTGL